MEKMVVLLLGTAIGALFFWFLVLPALGVLLAIFGAGLLMILFAH